MKEAWFYKKLENNRVHCQLCPHDCKIAEGKYGICGVRQNREGTLYTLVYGKAIAMHIDPIEKKPLFHVHPGSSSLSVATVGCNFSCTFCQNHDISQMPRGPQHRILGDDVTPEQIVDLAVKRDCKTIAYTYTEPTIYYEYAFDTAKLAHERGILNVFVTNGYISAEPLRKISPYLDAVNVDLKGFDDEFYKKIVGGDFKSVLNTLRLMKELGIWVEVTTLVVPTYVDADDQLREVARFINNDLGEETPWHISRFHPQYKCTHLPPTRVDVLRRAREIGQEEGIRYVYSGNVPGDVGESTFCYSCGEMLIERYGFQIISNKIQGGKCPFCGVEIDGIGM